MTDSSLIPSATCKGVGVMSPRNRECIDYKNSMNIDEDPLRGMLSYLDLGFSHTLHVLDEKRRRYEHLHLRRKGSPFPSTV